MFDEPIHTNLKHNLKKSDTCDCCHRVHCKANQQYKVNEVINKSRQIIICNNKKLNSLLSWKQQWNAYKMQAEKRGSQWDVMMNIIIDSEKFLNKSDYSYSTEFSTIDFLNRKDDIQ